MAKSKKKKKLKLPKRIAGVKIPKAARKGPVADFLNSSGGQVLLAEALVLAAGLFGVGQLRSGGSDGTQQDVRGTLEEASARLTYACSEALRAFRAALAEPLPDVSTNSDVPHIEEPEVVTPEEGADVKKKRGPRSVEASTTH